MKDILAERLGGTTLRPDTAFSWVVCFSSFLSHVFHVGYSFAVVGVLQIEQQKALGITEVTSSWIVSVHLCLLFLGGPPASVLMKKTSVRAVQVIGGGCLILGHALCAATTSSWQLFLFFGVLAGAGSSFTYTASSEILRHHFKKHIYLASAIAVAGSYVGLCALPPLIQTIFHEYSFNTAMGILSTFFLVHILAAVVYIEPDAEIDDQYSCQSSEPDRKMSEMPDKVQSSAQDIEFKDLCEADMGCEEATPNAAHDQTIAAHHHSLPQQFVSLVKNIKVRLFLINAFFWNFACTAFFSLISGYMLTKVCMTEEQSTLGVTINGGVGLVGVALVSALSQLSFDRLIIHALGPAVYGITTILIVFSTTIAHYYAGMVIYGMSYGALIANLLAVSYDICGPEQMVLLFSLELASESIGSLVGPPLCAILAEKYGSKVGLIFSGVCAVVASLIMLPAIISNIRHKRGDTTKPSAVTDEQKHVNSAYVADPDPEEENGRPTLSETADEKFSADGEVMQEETVVAPDNQPTI